MRTLYFVTSNPNKYKEVAEILKPHGIQVEWANIKLKEIQSKDVYKRQIWLHLKMSAMRNMKEN